MAVRDSYSMQCISYLLPSGENLPDNTKSERLLKSLSVDVHQMYEGCMLWLLFSSSDGAEAVVPKIKNSVLRPKIPSCN